MIKEAIEKIQSMDVPNVVEDDYGVQYVDKKMYRLSVPAYAKPLEMRTLSSLIEYINGFFKKNDMATDYMLHVVSPERVELISALDGDREREVLAVAKAELPKIPFGEFIENERMLITVQSMFAEGEDTDRALLLRFAGTTTSGSVKEYGDDGVTQKATIKTGVASKAEAIVPSPCVLRPYRTFNEVEQPASRFIFRMRENERTKTIESALYEADGGAWRNEARANICRYLQEHLKGKTEMLVIA